MRGIPEAAGSRVSTAMRLDELEPQRQKQQANGNMGAGFC